MNWTNNYYKLALTATLVLAASAFSIGQITVSSADHSADTKIFYLNASGNSITNDDSIESYAIGNFDQTTSEAISNQSSLYGEYISGNGSDTTNITLSNYGFTETDNQSAYIQESQSSRPDSFFGHSPIPLTSVFCHTSDSGGLDDIFTVGSSGSYVAQATMTFGGLSTQSSVGGYDFWTAQLIDLTANTIVFNSTSNGSYYSFAPSTTLSTKTIQFNSTNSLVAGHQYELQTQTNTEADLLFSKEASSSLTSDTSFSLISAQAAPEPNPALVCLPVVGIVFLSRRGSSL